MATSMTHSVSYPFSAQRLWEIISTDEYWRDLLESINSSHGKLESFESSGETVTVVMRQGVPEDRLPSAVTKIRPGDLHIPRQSTFTHDGNAIRGTIEASVEGAPAKIHGTVVTSGDPATTTYEAEVTVSVPFVGGKIEKAVIEQLIDLLDREAEQTVTWEAAHPA
ncbi:DUF2505 domain-containing protein [Gordonia sp. CPCC 205515]|uniref:DUF2505 domain-containing protein n=1 Tax=Gordonia sp. CPCC 205515 TaxID=3140791 RepID=UPI003AF3E55E